MNLRGDVLKRLFSVEALLFLVVFFNYSYIYGGASHNHNARYDTIFSFVERGSSDYRSFRINKFYDESLGRFNTEDWSHYKGNYYSNKAPGTALLGILVYLPLYETQSLLGFEPLSPQLTALNSYLINLCVSVFLVSLSVVYLYRTFLLLSVSTARALCISFVFAFCTMMYPYSTQLWGHTTSAAFVVFSLYYYVRNSGRKDSFIAGACTGMAFAVDYFALFAAGLLALSYLVQRRSSLSYFLIGLFIPLLVVGWYHYICFDSPFTLATTHWQGIPRKSEIFDYFKGVPLTRVLELIVDPFRGLWVGMPVLIMSSVGFYEWFKRDSKDSLLWICLITILGYLLLNASFIGWHGGRTTFMRYQIIAIPFWLLPLKEVQKTKVALVTSGLLALVSFCNMMATAFVTPLCSVDAFQSPLFKCVYLHFIKGIFQPYKFGYRDSFLAPETFRYAEYTSWTLGELLGLQSFWSLCIPLIVTSMVMAIVFSLNRGYFSDRVRR